MSIILQIRNFYKHTIIFFIFLLAASYITFPLIFNLGSLTTGLGDELVIAWIQNWVIYALSTGKVLTLFDTNTYYPFSNSLAFSDLFLVSSLFSYIPLILMKEPIVVVNFTLISSLILLGFSMYLLSYYITKDFLTSVICGMLVIFSPAVLDKVTHLQILAIQWVPLAILFFLKFLDSSKSRYLTISLFFFLLQTYNSFLPGYFIIFSYLIFFIFFYFCKKTKIKPLITLKNTFLIILFLLLIVPIAIPYYKVSIEHAYTRDIRDAIHFALQPEDFLYSSNFSRLSYFINGLPINKFSQNDEFKPGYLGFVFTLLVIISIWYLIRNFKKKDFYLHSFITTAIIGLILSFGPALHFGRQTVHIPFPIPLPYAFLYYIAPGFAGFRNSARWEMLFILCASVAISIILRRVLNSYSLKSRIIFFTILLLLIITEFNFPMHFVSIPQKKDFPKEYAWLSSTPRNTIIIELPIYNWNIIPYTQNEMLRQYYGTLYFRKTVNGYSGFSPPEWQNLVMDTLANFPSPKSIKNLKRIGIQYVLVHTDEYDALSKAKLKVNNITILDGPTIVERINNDKQMVFVKNFNNTYIYKF